MPCNCPKEYAFDINLSSGEKAVKDSCISCVPLLLPQSTLNQWPKNATQADKKKKAAENMDSGMNAWRIVKRFMEDDSLERLIPKFVRDTHQALLTWIESKEGKGIIHPFDMLRRLIFHLTLHVLCIPDIVNNYPVREYTLGELQLDVGKIDATSHKEWLINQVYWFIECIMRNRDREREDTERNKKGKKKKKKSNNNKDQEDKMKETGPSKASPKRPSNNDAMGYMMDRDMNSDAISSMVTGTAASSMEEYGSPAGWILCFIGQDRKWYTRIRKEVDSVIAKHSKHSKEHPVDVIRRLSYNSWQSEFPSVNLCIFETFKVHRAMRGAADKTSTTMRKETCGVKLKESGKFVMQSYLAADPNAPYKDPFEDGLKWDPLNFKGKTTWDAWEEHDLSYSRVASGTCIDKLQLTITTVMFVAHYNFSVCNDSGEETLDLNKNLRSLDPHMPGEVYLKCSVRNPCVDWDDDVKKRRSVKKRHGKQKNQGKKKRKQKMK
ncbi:hypothetical protein BGZ63DRAFT_42588 [Mariannaea sp. PMI_226]|nr:hypothetical protein BGZ63DRAFT_42588 [Mariannaea sp. PMI_226]